MRVEVALNDALALVELFGDALFELAVPAQAEVQGIALHFDQVAGDRPQAEIEVEQGQIGAAQRYLVTDRVGLTCRGVKQVDV